MKLIIKMILAAILLSLPLGADAQDVITRPKKPKQHTTAPAPRKLKKKPKPSTPSSSSPAQAMGAPEMCDKGLVARHYGDYSEAVRWFRRSAEQGFAAGQCVLGIMYEKGKGVTKDLSEARRWYQKAADQGDIDAKRRLAELNGQ